MTAPTAPWHGRLELAYEQRDRATRPVRSRVQAPLKVQRPFYPEGPDTCHSLILHTAGGIVGGDRLSQRIVLGPQARAVVTTAAASKLYRSAGETAVQQIALQLGPDAHLDWVPQAAIAFTGSRYRQEVRIDLAPGAAWFGCEIVRFGRSARGEVFDAGEWRGRTEVWRQGRPLWIDRQHVTGATDTVTSPNALAGQPVLGAIAWFGRPVSDEVVAAARECWLPEWPGEVGVTRGIDGLVCRYRGPSAAAATRWAIALWHLVRAESGRTAPVVPRAWQILA